MSTLRQLCDAQSFQFYRLEDAPADIQVRAPGYVLRFKAIAEDGKLCAHGLTIGSTPLESDGYYYILVGHANLEAGVCGCCPASWDGEYEISEAPLIQIDGVPNGQ